MRRTALSGNACYTATKAEVVILTRRFALELGQHGITVRVRLHELVDQQVLDR